MIQHLDGTQADETLARYLKGRFGTPDTRIVVSYGSREDAAAPRGDRASKQVTLGDGRLLRCRTVGGQRAGEPETLHVIVERPKLAADLGDGGGPLRFRAGVFDYYGFGQGGYWSVSGGKIECSPSEAREHALREGVEFVYVDRVEDRRGHSWNRYVLPAAAPVPAAAPEDAEDAEDAPLTYKDAYEALHARVCRMARALRAKGQGAWVDAWLGDGILDVEVADPAVGADRPEPEEPTSAVRP